MAGRLPELAAALFVIAACGAAAACSGQSPDGPPVAPSVQPTGGRMVLHAPTDLAVGETGSFTVIANSGADSLSVEWGDGTISPLASISGPVVLKHVFLNTGEFTVHAIAHHGSGDTGQARAIVAAH